MQALEKSVSVPWRVGSMITRRGLASTLIAPMIEARSILLEIGVRKGGLAEKTRSYPDSACGGSLKRMVLMSFRMVLISPSTRSNRSLMCLNLSSTKLKRSLMTFRFGVDLAVELVNPPVEPVKLGGNLDVDSPQTQCAQCDNHRNRSRNHTGIFLECLHALPFIRCVYSMSGESVGQILSLEDGVSAKRCHLRPRDGPDRRYRRGP